MTSPEYGTSGTSTPPAPQALFTYRGVEVHVQPDGLIDAKDMHLASGCSANLRPSHFLKTPQTVALIKALSLNCSVGNILRTQKGRNGGTWLCRELAVAYAAYLDADFHVFVLRVFLAVGDGKLVPASASAQAPAPFDVAPLLAEFRSLKADMEAMRQELGEVVRPAHIRKATVRDKHLTIIMERENGTCPCCRSWPAALIGIEGKPQWTPGYCVSRYKDIRRAKLRETWPVCKECRYLLRNDAFHRSKGEHFSAYQETVLAWLVEREPDFLRVP